MHSHSAKSVAGIALLVVAVGAVAIGLRRQVRDPAPGASEAPTVAASELRAEPARPGPVTVFYFHGDTRCATCRAIEAQTAEVVRQRFAEELALGKLRFESVDFEAPPDRHFQEDYDLAFGSVVVQGSGEDRPWENLAEVWTLIHDDPAAFEAYIVDHVRRMLEATG